MRQYLSWDGVGRLRRKQAAVVWQCGSVMLKMKTKGSAVYGFWGGKERKTRQDREQVFLI